jgi:hypothetical protein
LSERIGLQNGKNHIFSDSKDALVALSSYKISSSIVMQCWFSLKVLSTLKRVCLSWVPGHYDITGNEMDDKLINRRYFTLCARECPALSIARTFTIGKPLPNDREYKQTTVSQIQGFSARRVGTDV